MPTAYELKPEERQAYINVARQRNLPLTLTPEEHQVYDALIRRIKKASAELKQRFKVQRVILFGALAHKAWYRPDADVDLAVEGLNSQDYWKAWRLAEEIIDDRLVELIDIETASEPLQRAIQRTGIAL